jgi:hypothetical protein
MPFTLKSHLLVSYLHTLLNFLCLSNSKERRKNKFEVNRRAVAEYQTGVNVNTRDQC